MSATESRPELEPPTLTEVYGRPAVTIPARHRGHTLKSGEVIYKDATEVYLWARQPGSETIDLTKPDGKTYTCGPFSCTCPAFLFSTNHLNCKHLDALWRLGLFLATDNRQPTNDRSVSHDSVSEA